MPATTLAAISPPSEVAGGEDKQASLEVIILALNQGKLLWFGSSLVRTINISKIAVAHGRYEVYSNRVALRIENDLGRAFESNCRWESSSGHFPTCMLPLRPIGDSALVKWFVGNCHTRSDGYRGFGDK